MNKKLLGSWMLSLIIVPGTVVTLFAWGFWGHQQINHAAIFTLPPEMFGFYKEHVRFITEHAVDPDKRRYADPNEAPRHFIDLFDLPFHEVQIPLWSCLQSTRLPHLVKGPISTANGGAQEHHEEQVGHAPQNPLLGLSRLARSLDV